MHNNVKFIKNKKAKKKNEWGSTSSSPPERIN